MKPGVKKIVFGGIMFVVGAVVIPLALIIPLIISDEGPTKFEIPGKLEINVDEAGKYYVWNEFRTIYKGKSFNVSEFIPGSIQIDLISNESGESQYIEGDTSISSSEGNNKRNSIGYFEISKPGEYTIKVNSESESRIFSFGKSNIVKVFLRIFLGGILSLLIASAGFGLIVFGVIQLVRKS